MMTRKAIVGLLIRWNNIARPSYRITGATPTKVLAEVAQINMVATGQRALYLHPRQTLSGRTERIAF